MSDLTIGKKMFLIGVVIVTGLSFLAGKCLSYQHNHQESFC